MLISMTVATPESLKKQAHELWNKAYNTHKATGDDSAFLLMSQLETYFSGVEE